MQASEACWCWSTFRATEPAVRPLQRYDRPGGSGIRSRSKSTLEACDPRNPSALRPPRPPRTVIDDLSFSPAPGPSNWTVKLLRIIFQLANLLKGVTVYEERFLLVEESVARLHNAAGTRELFRICTATGQGTNQKRSQR